MRILIGDPKSALIRLTASSACHKKKGRLFGQPFPKNIFILLKELSPVILNIRCFFQRFKTTVRRHFCILQQSLFNCSQINCARFCSVHFYFDRKYTGRTRDRLACFSAERFIKCRSNHFWFATDTGDKWCTKAQAVCTQYCCTGACGKSFKCIAFEFGFDNDFRFFSLRTMPSTVGLASACRHHSCFVNSRYCTTIKLSPCFYRLRNITGACDHIPSEPAGGFARYLLR
jgi:hypothetical protein